MTKKEEILKMIAEGKTSKEIIELVKCTADYINKLKRKIKMQPIE
jgi:DNA-binding CsgD family transcriptional regulator